MEKINFGVVLVVLIGNWLLIPLILKFLGKKITFINGFYNGLVAVVLIIIIMWFF